MTTTKKNKGIEREREREDDLMMIMHVFYSIITPLAMRSTANHTLCCARFTSNDGGFLSRWISFPKESSHSNHVSRGLFMRALSPARAPLSNNPFSSDLLPLLYNYRRRCLRLLIRSPPPLPPSRLISEIISLRSNVKLFFPLIEAVFFICPIPCPL